MIIPVAVEKLNFKVLGGSAEPANPKENTIWVSTGAEISGWAFSSMEPENPTEGMVWFETGTSSLAPVNALKKNAAMLYPTKCRQYVSGAWEAKTAKTYQNGAWSEWLRYLFKEGNEYPTITGGFQALSPSSEWSVSLSNNGTDLVLSVGSWYNGNAYGWACTKNAVDVTEYKELLVSLTATGTWDAGGCSVYLSATKAGASVASTAVVNTTAKQTVVVDISNLSGLYYPCVMVRGRATNVGNTNYIHEIILR